MQPVQKPAVLTLRTTGLEDNRFYQEMERLMGDCWERHLPIPDRSLPIGTKIDINVHGTSRFIEVIVCEHQYSLSHDILAHVATISVDVDTDVTPEEFASCVAKYWLSWADILEHFK